MRGARERSLLQTPVVLVHDQAVVPVVRAGICPAGADPVTVVVVEPTRIELVAAVHEEGAEVVLAECTPRTAVRVANTARDLLGRPLPVLGVHTVDGLPEVDRATLDLLVDPRLEGVNIPVPSIDDEAGRRALWDPLRDARVEERHHLVEVDGRPALTQLGDAGGDVTALDPGAALAAGAAGVLAGRMAAANRRWHQQATH